MENGDNLTLTCTASGGPSNMFRWVKDGIYTDGNTLTISDVAATDGGLYECVVNNTAGDSSFNITIYGRTYISCDIVHTLLCSCLVAPQFITEPEDVEEFIGTAVNLTCSAEGSPVPDIMWTFQGMMFVDTTVNNMNSTYAESTIVITDLILNQGGDYACEINSVADSMPLTAEANVTVIGSKLIYK